MKTEKMRKIQPDEEDEEPLIDTTLAIPKRSKKTERQQKKWHVKAKASKQEVILSDLPSELMIEILTRLRPSDIFRLSRVNHALRNYILEEEVAIGREIIFCRYAVLSKSFLLPVLLNSLDEEAQVALLDTERQATHLHIHKKPYQHIKPPDPETICTCLTCMLAWNNLCLIVDFAHWQRNLEVGEPIPTIARGKFPEWNENLVSANADIVSKALYSTLWYAAILEGHLNSIIRSIRRHGNNKGNKRKRFRMTPEDVAAENDLFLDRSGPPTMDFPFHRDSYYMLESYVPNRGWNSEDSEWKYMPASQHERDVAFVKAWSKRRKETATEEAERKLTRERELEATSQNDR